MGTRSIISFTPSKDMNVTFDPFKLPEGNPFAPFDGEVDLKKALRNVKKNTEEVRFKKGHSYNIYCHWDGYPEGVGVALVNNFTDEDMVANLIAAGDCSSIMGHVVPYTTRGEKFKQPFDKKLGSWVPGWGVEFVHRWTPNGWEVAEISDFYDEDGVEKLGVDFDFQPTAEVAADYLDR